MKRCLRGFDGGMMVHTGYLQGDLDAIDYTAKAAIEDAFEGFQSAIHCTF